MVIFTSLDHFYGIYGALSSDGQLNLLPAFSSFLLTLKWLKWVHSKSKTRQNGFHVSRSEQTVNKNTTQTQGKSFLFLIFTKDIILGLICLFPYILWQNANSNGSHRAWAACGVNQKRPEEAFLAVHKVRLTAERHTDRDGVVDSKQENSAVKLGVVLSRLVNDTCTALHD